MPLSNNPITYESIRHVADTALADALGVRITLETAGQARHWIQRFYKMRKLDREESKKVYPLDHQMFGVSPYDNLICNLNGERVSVVRGDVSALKMESLSG